MKLTVAFTCASLPLNLYTSVFGCGCGFGFERKKARIGGFACPYSPPLFVHVPFPPPPLLILAFQPIVFHTIVTEGHYTLFSIEEIFFKNRAELFDCGVSNDMSKVTHVLLCIVLTQCFCFASSDCFGFFFKN